MDGSVQPKLPPPAATAVLVSMALYVAACPLPALIFHVRRDLGNGGFAWEGYRSDNGISLLFAGLVFGWMRLNFTAFANPLLWMGWIFLARRNWNSARVCSLGALIWSIETLQLLFQPMLWDEAAVNKGFLAAPHIGFALWIASMVVIYMTSLRGLKSGAA